MSDTMEKRYRDLTKNWVTPVFKHHGFKKIRESYVYAANSLSWYFDLQRSRYDSRDRIEFTINCGVFVPGVVSAYIQRPEKRTISLTDCCVYVRIGMLSKSRTDQWWVLTSTDDSELVDSKIGTEVQEAIEQLGIPFVRQFNSREKIATFLVSPSENTKHINPMSDAIRLAYAAILYKLLGDTQKQRVAMVKAVDLSKNSPVEEHIASLAQHYLSGV